MIFGILTFVFQMSSCRETNREMSRPDGIGKFKRDWLWDEQFLQLTIKGQDESQSQYHV
jgi:hypothetical protein